MSQRVEEAAVPRHHSHGQLHTSSAPLLHPMGTREPSGVFHADRPSVVTIPGSHTGGHGNTSPGNPSLVINTQLGPATSGLALGGVGGPQCSTPKKNNEEDEKPKPFFHRRGTQTLWSMGTLSLLVLVIQNASLVLMTRASRVGVPKSELYHTGSLVVNQEILKFVFCIGIFIYERGLSHRPAEAWAQLRKILVSKDTVLLAVPAGLFTFQNFLVFVSLANLDVMPFQMLSQTKLLSAAIFSVWWLDKRLVRLQWLSLLLLTLGVLFAQWGQSPPPAAKHTNRGPAPGHLPVVATPMPRPTTTQRGLKSTTEIASTGNNDHHDDVGTHRMLQQHQHGDGDAATPQQQHQHQPHVQVSAGAGHDDHPTQSAFVGVISCIVSGLFSSFAGVYFEKVVKTTPPSLAVRNVQLGVFGIPMSFLSMIVLDVFAKAEPGRPFHYWQGYSLFTFLLVLVHAFGGLLVAVVVKYTDNIMKGFATAVAILVSGAGAAVLWGYVPSFAFVLGCGIVVGSTMLYHVAEQRPKVPQTQPPPMAIKSDPQDRS